MTRRQRVTHAATAVTVSVVICTYTERRWRELLAGVRAVQEQLRDGDELIVVVDHAPDVLARAQQELSGCRVAASTHGQGLSGARNTGVDLATGDVVAFLDD